MGQIKSPGERHEKDDRHRIDDRRRFVLGWTNAEKIAALEAEQRQLEGRLGELGARIANCRSEQKALMNGADVLVKLDEYRDFRELDWRFTGRRGCPTGRGAAAAGACIGPAQGADRSAQGPGTDLAETEARLESKQTERAKTEQKREDAEVLRQQTRTLLDTLRP